MILVNNNQTEGQQFIQEINAQTDNSSSVNFQYRPDIDGLRTIAVGIVIVFHAWPEFMPGGFIGVDIFFVISGYLISQIIIKQNQQNRFSYFNFYSRRIKRIYPTLIVVLIFVLYMSIKYLKTRQLQIVTQTMAASSVFAANIQILTHQKGYFDPDIESNPLLHLWSLGVEEQFYICWPFLISIVVNTFKKKGTYFLIFFTISSFIISIACVYSKLKFAFNFPLNRFWQMSVGGIIAYKPDIKFNKKILNIISIVGFITIFITIWIINSESLFPGWWALIPTLSCSAIIIAGKNSMINKYLLSTQIFVFLGKISYPLYLWHWPLLVFSRTIFPQNSEHILSKPEVIIVLTVLFSILTYYLIENNIRFRKQRIVTFLLFILIVLIGVAALSITMNPQKFSEIENSVNLNLNMAQFMPSVGDYYEKAGKSIPNVSKQKNRKFPRIQTMKGYLMFPKYTDNYTILSQINPSSKFYIKDTQFLDSWQVLNEGSDKLVLLVGDSHALALAIRYKHLYNEFINNNKSKQYPTILSMAVFEKNFIPKNRLYNFTMNLIKLHKPQRIVIALRWQRYFIKKSPQQIQSQMIEFHKGLELIKSLGVEIYVLTLHLDGQKWHDYNPSRAIINNQQIIPSRVKPYSHKQFKDKFAKYIQMIETPLKKSAMNIIDYADNLCYEDTCHVVTPKGYPILFDANHLAYYISQFWITVVDSVVYF